MMNSKLRTGAVLAALAALVGLAVGCGSDETVSTGSGAGSSSESDWRSRSMTYSDGSELAIADFDGQPIFIETFATWCSNCEKQLKETQIAAEKAGDDAVFLAISVETDLTDKDLVSYLDDHDYGSIQFAIATPEMLLDLKNAFGNSVLNPPSTPKIVVRSDGGEPELVTGPESATDLAERLGLA